jgi:hypothetical protein
MAIVSVHCPAAHAMVTRVTDLEGETTQVICAEYEERIGICRLKRTALEGGPLSRRLNRLAQQTLDARTTRCDLQ